MHGLWFGFTWRFDSGLVVVSVPDYATALTLSTYDPDTNPSRITPRNLSDVAVGADNLWKKDTYALSGTISLVNATNKASLYNFLSSFSGTHFVSPRVLQAELTFHF